jgi:hypothetical protein
MLADFDYFYRRKMTAVAPRALTRSAFATLLEERLDRLIDLWHKLGAHGPTFGSYDG